MIHDYDALVHGGEFAGGERITKLLEQPVFTGYTVPPLKYSDETDLSQIIDYLADKIEKKHTFGSGISNTDDLRELINKITLTPMFDMAKSTNLDVREYQIIRDIMKRLQRRVGTEAASRLAYVPWTDDISELANVFRSTIDKSKARQAIGAVRDYLNEVQQEALKSRMIRNYLA